jgi:hypothetical protein
LVTPLAAVMILYGSVKCQLLSTAVCTEGREESKEVTSVEI